MYRGGYQLYRYIEVDSLIFAQILNKKVGVPWCIFCKGDDGYTFSVGDAEKITRVPIE